jgi:RNA polymerase sigma-70 factor, ECF subfamily
METALTAAMTPADEAVAPRISTEAFDQIIRQHQRRVYRVIYLLVKDVDVADTLTQECFFRAYRNLASFRGECRIDTWLLRIAMNLVRDHGKNRRNGFWRRLIGLEDAANEPAAVSHFASPERQMQACQELDAVWTAVASLPKQQRTIFLLRFAEEMSLVEIADVLRVKVGTVKAHLFRATDRVRQAVKVSQ